ncbi:exostosin-like glycosyltransferase [Haematococcus lacustris]
MSFLGAVAVITLLTSAVGQPVQRARFVLTEDAPVRMRCSAAIGDWCAAFHAQEPVSWKPAPRGSKQCPTSGSPPVPCNGVGNCNADSGYCECPAGWTGAGCGEQQQRPCTNTWRSCEEADQPPRSFSDAEGRDRDPTQHGGTQSRCLGICDPEVASCWCDGPQGRIPAPKGSPPGTPPLKRGRPMNTPECSPKEGADGTKYNAGGWRSWADIYGPGGWCVAEQPVATCPCIIDGLAGHTCEDTVEMFCINQCSGHGECNLGFCKCDPGWYGHDCSRKVAGQVLEPSRIPQRRWLQGVAVEPPAAQEPPPAATRKRPLIFVYDLEPLFSSKLLQYRIASSWCIHRRYHQGNVSLDIPNWVYSVDTILHESLLQSQHRTFDPEEADFFYVPQYSTCFIFPIKNWADFPWFGPPDTANRVGHAALMLLEVHRYLSTQFPYWNRRQGRDHIFLFTHDEGACWVPRVLTSAVWLTHWGRMELNHTSNTAYMGDNYNEDSKCSRMPDGWRHHITGHACYDPVKDLVVPSHKTIDQYSHSPLMGAAPKERDIFFFFRGDVGKHRLPNYSRGIRQAVYKLVQDNNLKEKYNILVGDGGDVPGSYSELLSRSLFCLVAPGDGYSARMEDAALNGCIPVIIQDGVHVEFETLLNFTQFTVRVLEKDIPNLVNVLKSIPPASVRNMQRHLSRVFHRFRWAFSPQQRLAAQALTDSNLGLLEATRRGKAEEAGPTSGRQLQRGLQQPQQGGAVRLPRPFRGDVAVDDAFATIMQWLHSRIPFTR